MDSALPKRQGLYDPANEHDACGVGFVAHMKGEKSHSIVEQGLLILKNINHRGAVGADPLQGDGAGILIQIPDQLYRDDMIQKGVSLPAAGEYGVGMVFLPREAASCKACEEEIERAVRAEGQVVLGWRDVPVNAECPMSPTVKATEPVIRQIFVGRGKDVLVTDALERKLYIIRKRSSKAIKNLNLKHCGEFYISSFSARTIVYKGLLLADQVGLYYRDLADARCVSALAMVHQRFSTNTFPSWALAHPFRMIAHNGEINTVRGNVNWMRAREKCVHSPVLGDDLEKVWPLIYPGQSDSASFDNALELLTMSGYSLAHAVMMMIPEAWEKHNTMDPKRHAFYEYHAAMMEPWDGPAAVAFTDGRQIGATLDRNGLRPARYLVTKDDLVVMASESGVLPIDDSRILKKWKLQPGKMFLIDMEQGRIIDDAEIKNALATAKPYSEWINKIRIKIDDLKSLSGDVAPIEHEASLLDMQQLFGYTQEDIKRLMLPMAINGQEPIASMGNDASLTVLSKKNKTLYDYFRQVFAQVTNPPIDPIREDMVMSLVSFIGPRPNLLNSTDINPPIRLEVEQPILSELQIEQIRNIEKYTNGKFRSHELDITYPLDWGKEGIEARLASLACEAEDAVKEGANILIITDRKVSKTRVAIPALLATSTVHLRLVNAGLRTSTGLVVETGSAREVHHFALLAGYGAEAIHPYIAIETLRELAEGNKAKEEEYIAHYVKAIGKGLCKTMSKMGISTYMSYTGAQVFEAVGLTKEFVDKYFTNTSSNVEGIGLFEVAQEAINFHTEAFGNDPLLENDLDAGGEYNYRVRGEDHMWTPEAIADLQHAVRTENGNAYKQYANIINDQSKRHLTLRGLFEIKKPFDPIDISEVEPAKEIVKRFATGAMSLGSISTEAHTNLAIAMNRIGGKSNTGEGGEDAKRFSPVTKKTMLSEIIGEGRIERDIELEPGDSLRSAIKQVASGRFGVTAEYCVNADQIQIKMAQGAKPGEGGQLPGHKVSEYIGFLRHSVPGVGLISPPPHHDIYSIEDLAQLIHDLKNVNPKASISVKLVSEVGVGTVAAGVAKAKADHIVIAGHDGGTGASPQSSIKHAGSAWELGLSEAQQTLVLNRLRGRVRVQVDGQIKTGRDVVIGALLGADEFGFATAPLVASGCIMMRKCQLNTCPVGVATQDPVLRKRFAGRPEHVVRYFFYVAEEVREIMASMGIRKFDELIGHSEYLDKRAGIEHWKAKGLDFSKIFYQPERTESTAIMNSETQDHCLDKSLDNVLIAKAQDAINNGKKVEFSSNIINVNRTVGAMISGAVAEKYGDHGLADDTIKVHLTGTAGQSFAAFLAGGITFDLIGEANDYVGKSMSGGKLIIHPSADFSGRSNENIICGNTCLYGATSGEAYISGVAGERFAVRNSGATAVIEGVGDHGCEYMTGGTVVVLGNTGRNFAAGMSGGIAYVYDVTGKFHDNCNLTQVTLETVQPANKQSKVEPRHLDMADEEILRKYISNHAEFTGSQIAKDILANWEQSLAKFVKVFPVEYRQALAHLAVKKEA
ncbi:MAG: glutamate synthase large subunit [Succinivibrionaceae bacterium]